MKKIATMLILVGLCSAVGINGRIGIGFPTIDGESKTVMLLSGYMHSADTKWFYSEIGVEHWSKSETIEGVSMTAWLLSIPCAVGINYPPIRVGIGSDIMNVLGAKISDGLVTISDSESKFLPGKIFFWGQLVFPIGKKLSFMLTPKFNLQTAGDEYTIDINTFSTSLSMGFN